MKQKAVTGWKHPCPEEKPEMVQAWYNSDSDTKGFLMQYNYKNVYSWRA